MKSIRPPPRVGQTGDYVNQIHTDEEWPGNGLAIVQSNRPEDLCRILIDHLRRYPLGPLEDEVILTQSNGVARWLELEMATDPERGGHGICASTEFLLPARFLWNVYRTVLGDETLPEHSPFDSDRMRWCLHRLLPELIDRPEFAPLADYLARDVDDPMRSWQLAVALADLFEQYQFYRADWLLNWEAGEDTVSDARKQFSELPERQRWQPALWRAVLQSTGPSERQCSRAHLHRRFMNALETASGDEPFLESLPRRVVVFGISSMPAQVIEGLAALASSVQVLVCLHNPCRHYWADIIDGRDLLRSRPGKRLNLPPAWSDDPDKATLHEAANPLLASWGRQGRDLYALLDEYDDPERYRHWFDRIDVFTPHVAESEAATLLESIQQGVLDLAAPPTNDEERRAVPAGDDSIRFHVAHSRQREVEVLHDQLLAALQADDDLHPRDIMVMVPDIDAYAPHIEAVFGAHSGSDMADSRYIPYSIGDRRERLASPCLRAVETLLNLPNSRMTAGEAMDLLNVPAVRQRFDIAEDELDRIGQWLEGSGIRWGLDGNHRTSLGLSKKFEQNSWRFGIRRMLLGHATGEAEPFDDIEPYDEVSSGEADLAGRLAQFVDQLQRYWRTFNEPTNLAGWSERLGHMIEDFFAPVSSVDELACQQLELGMEEIQSQAHGAGFDGELPLETVREVLLECVDQAHVTHRFLGGKVNFSTLMPMRAIPFRMVCLLGMNDGDYPRTRKPADFDLMSQARLFRPGDRSRREDDRYLFLEALLSARRRLYISWVGKSVRNDEDQPPSVLVGQLRDHIAAGWCLDAADEDSDAGQQLLEAITVEHPLQPFSPRYFDDACPLFTYAGEWRRAHDRPDSPADASKLALPPIDDSIDTRVLGRFLKQPVKHFLEQRFRTRLAVDETSLPETEPFSIQGLERWQLEEELLTALVSQHASTGEAGGLERAAQRLRLAGRLPMGAIGEAALEESTETIRPVAEYWQAAVNEWPGLLEPQPVTFEHSGPEGCRVLLEQWLSGLRTRADGGAAFITATSTRLKADKKTVFRPRWEKLIHHWSLHLLANAQGLELHTLVAHRDGIFEWKPVEADLARGWLADLIDHWLEGMRRPLPVAAATAGQWLEALRSKNPDTAFSAASKAYFDEYGNWGEVVKEPALQRFYPDFEQLRAGSGDGDDFAYWAKALYEAPIEHWYETAGDAE